MRDYWLSKVCRVVAHRAAGDRGFELVHYRAIPQWYVGAGIASWTM